MISSWIFPGEFELQWGSSPVGPAEQIQMLVCFPRQDPFLWKSKMVIWIFSLSPQLESYAVGMQSDAPKHLRQRPVRCISGNYWYWLMSVCHLDDFLTESFAIKLLLLLLKCKELCLSHSRFSFQYENVYQLFSFSGDSYPKWTNLVPHCTVEPNHRE